MPRKEWLKLVNTQGIYYENTIMESAKMFWRFPVFRSLKFLWKTQDFIKLLGLVVYLEGHCLNAVSDYQVIDF